MKRPLSAKAKTAPQRAPASKPQNGRGRAAAEAQALAPAVHDGGQSDGHLGADAERGSGKQHPQPSLAIEQPPTPGMGPRRNSRYSCPFPREARAIVAAPVLVLPGGSLGSSSGGRAACGPPWPRIPPGRGQPGLCWKYSL